jgi:hypothetical protein
MRQHLLQHRNILRSGDVHIATFICVSLGYPSYDFGPISLENAMGSMRMALEECHGLHGEFRLIFLMKAINKRNVQGLGPKNPWVQWDPWVHGSHGARALGPRGIGARSQQKHVLGKLMCHILTTGVVSTLLKG